MVPFGVIWREARLGKTIGRIQSNVILQQWREEIRGLVLDLGCGQSPSYGRLLGLGNGTEIRLVRLDYNPIFHPTVVADLSQGIPFKGETADLLILSSVLYILPRPEELIREARRVLKPHGKLFLVAPLIFPHHPEPTDYWRFTEQTLQLLLRETGFLQPTIVPFGGRWTAAAYLLAPFLRPQRLVAPLAYWLSMRLDAWTEKWFMQPPKCPIGYVVKATAE
jgi:SAM-dependent methyltransferase